ncbi:hypothetical protein DFQ27_006327 [Actinomortierella ambigua]|uniref:F-box domain-containing protein n=1 Tax=Actinomortierella ambigua TaxID=1343610 RepID=A0A9P6PYD2_9FUNG|nr:hypothetical protein DFQ27_006327 [Actinomortierella ambigua]
MEYDAPSPSDSSDIAPSLCLNPDAIEDLAPVQPTRENVLPDFPTLAWSEQSANDKLKGEKRLCYRHRPDLRSKRAADEIQLESLQQPLLRIDFLSITPPEIAFRILSYLDATSLCAAAQVCKSWKKLADDDVVWHRMCEQHIGLKCTKCGWGLPLLDKKKARRRNLDHPAKQAAVDSRDLAQQQQYHHHHSDSEPEDQPSSSCSSSQGDLHTPHLDPHPSPPISAASLSPIEPTGLGWPRRRSASNEAEDEERLLKRARLSRSPSPLHAPRSPLFQSPQPPAKPAEAPARRPWKEIYSERLIVERNWRKRNYRLKEFRGHTDGVMCLQFDETYLITGGYDNTAKVWNIETGECLRTLTGHALCIRALHFDEAKLITGSMDRTLKIWNYHTGQCIRTLQGHTDGIVTLDFDSRILVSGSADATIKIWNFATGECSTLKGHSDLINKVQIYEATKLFSASDDTTVKLWDLTTKTCLRTFTGHNGRVQCLQTSGDALISILTDRLRKAGGGINRAACDGRSLARQQSNVSTSNGSRRIVAPTSPLDGKNNNNSSSSNNASDTETRTMRSIVVTGGLDNTLKMWDIETGECLDTLWGHVEGVWSLAFDKLRTVSGSLDRTIKVWDTESGQCLYNLTGHEGPVTCVSLGDTRVVSGSDDGVVFVWDFGVRN